MSNEIIEEFIEWELSHRSTINKVMEILSDNLSSEPEALIASACEIEGYNGRIGELLAHADSYLDRTKMVLRPDKDSGTVDDRNMELNGLVAPVRLVRDRLESLASSIKQRLILIESLLAYHRQFHDHQMKEPARPF